MKTLSIITAAILLGLSAAALAADSGENHQDDSNATGPNPVTTFGGGSYRAGSYGAFAMQPAPHYVTPHHVVTHHAKR